MDCRFCSIRPAKYLAMPTLFGPADLCEVCAHRYRRYLRRARRQPRNETSGPPKAARFSDSIPPDLPSQEVNSCRNQV
jgi:hypothetical protein